MAVGVLFFGIDELYKTLKPQYTKLVASGDFEISAYAKIEDNKITWFDANGKESGIKNVVLNFAIVSSEKNFYRQIKMLEKMGVPRKKIIDGRVFQIQNLDIHGFLNSGVVYAPMKGSFLKDISHCIYPRVYQSDNQKFEIKLGLKSYISAADFEGVGVVEIGNFSAIGWKTLFELRMNNYHNYKNVSSFPAEVWDDELPENFSNPLGDCKIKIGNDVWIGRGAILKSNNPARPLIIGDGAVIAADSVVVKNVPPYAIVGGNPARFLKYRFSEDIIESLLRIKWWNWDLNKIYENFKYFNRVEEFIAMHDIRN